MKNKAAVTLALCALLSLSYAAAAGAQSGKDIINRVKDTFESLNTFSAAFTQTFEWQLAGESQSLEGTIVAAKGDRYRIETEDQIVVTDGVDVWNYSKVNNQVIIDKLGRSGESPLMRDLLVRYSEEYRAELRGDEAIGESSCYVVGLTPKEDAFIGEVTLWVDKGSYITRRIRQVDINKNVNVYDIDAIQINPELGGVKFKLVPPPGAEVIDLR